MLQSTPAVAIPVFARIYNKPCGTCHTVFPQLNPEGENVRAHGLHGLPPAVKPLKVGSLFDLPGTLPLALYFAGGGDLTNVDSPGERDPATTRLNLNFLRLLAGGELGSHLAFLADHELIETEPDTGDIEINTLPGGRPEVCTRCLSVVKKNDVLWRVLPVSACRVASFSTKHTVKFPWEGAPSSWDGTVAVPS